MPDNKFIWVCRAGRMPYPRAMELQGRLAQLRFEERINDILLVLEHPPTVTLGRFGKTANLLVPETELKRRGIAFYRSDRGGDVTFHCPGQLVVYPIMNLKSQVIHLRDFLSQIEDVAILTLQSFGISGERWSEHPGIWVGGKQIGAVGLRISRSVSMHGLSLNVNPDLNAFKIINLCGLPGKEATSISELLQRDVTVPEARRRLEGFFADIFNVRLEVITTKQVKEDCLAAFVAPTVV